MKMRERIDRPDLVPEIFAQQPSLTDPQGILHLDLFGQRQRQNHGNHEHARDGVACENVAHDLRHTGEEFRDLRDADADVVDGRRCAGSLVFHLE